MNDNVDGGICLGPCCVCCCWCGLCVVACCPCVRPCAWVCFCFECKCGKASCCIDDGVGEVDDDGVGDGVGDGDGDGDDDDDDDDDGDGDGDGDDGPCDDTVEEQATSPPPAAPPSEVKVLPPPPPPPTTAMRLADEAEAGASPPLPTSPPLLRLSSYLLSLLLLLLSLSLLPASLSPSLSSPLSSPSLARTTGSLYRRADIANASLTSSGVACSSRQRVRNSCKSITVLLSAMDGQAVSCANPSIAPAATCCRWSSPIMTTA